MRKEIEDLYRVFSRYRQPRDMVACPHCDVDPQPLFGVALRNLSGRALSAYAFKAISTWGEVAEFKHFLPRILELSVDESGLEWPGLHPHVIAGKLCLGNWMTWPAEEQAAILDTYAAQWNAAMRTDPFESPWLAANHVLAGPARILPELSRFLVPWAAAGLWPALQLAYVLSGQWSSVRDKRRFSDSYWQDLPSGTQLLDWFQSSARLDQLEAAFEETPTGPAADSLALAVDQWRWMMA